MRIIILLLTLAISGCATIRNVDTSDESGVRTALQEGDQITLTTRDDRNYQLTVVSLSDDAISGEDGDGQSVTIAFAEITQLQVREPRPGRTAALVGGTVGGLAILYLLAAAVASAALLSSL